MSAFGASTDHWAYAETGINLISSSNSTSGSNATAEDSNGNVVCETVFDTGATYQSVYEVCKGKTVKFYDTATSTDFRIGKVISGKVITGISVARNNKNRLNITIDGENCPSADSLVSKFTPIFPSGYLAGGKGAVAAGITVTAGKCISSSINVTAQVVKGLDSQGDQVCKEVYAGREEGGNELMTCDTAAAATVDTGWTLAPSGGLQESSGGYPTKTVDVFRNLAQDA